MSKAHVAQLVFVVVLVVAVIALGVEIFGRMDPDVIITWAYVAAVGLAGSTICFILRLSAKCRGLEKKSNQ